MYAHAKHKHSDTYWANVLVDCRQFLTRILARFANVDASAATRSAHMTYASEVAPGPVKWWPSSTSWAENVASHPGALTTTRWLRVGMTPNGSTVIL